MVPLFQASWCTINLLLEAVNSGEVVWRGRADGSVSSVFYVQNVRQLSKQKLGEWSLFLAIPVASAPEGPGCAFLGVACSPLS